MAPPTTSPHQLSLLADHLKLSLLEAQLDPSNNTNISRSLTTLHEGINELSRSGNRDPSLARLRAEYRDLYKQHYGEEAPTAAVAEAEAEDVQGQYDSESKTDRPTARLGRNKSVRFRDNPADPSTQPYRDEPDEEDTANRSALFASQGGGGGYSDDPSTDHSDFDNQQVYAHHNERLRDQDEQLDVLGQSIGRQRLLGIEMGNELDEQGVMLGDVEAGVDRHQSTLDRARGRLGRVARKSKENWSWVTIAILVVILVLLIAVLK
ncbi:hypothetical protein MBLNU230_g2332t1 [Neophaeotheca triangularis]